MRGISRKSAKSFALFVVNLVCVAIRFHFPGTEVAKTRELGPNEALRTRLANTSRLELAASKPVGKVRLVERHEYRTFSLSSICKPVASPAPSVSTITTFLAHT